MNLQRLDELINSLIQENDPGNDELIEFYIKKRAELVKQIWKNVEKGLSTL